MKKKVRISDAAKILKVSTQTLRNWDNSGKYRSKRSKGGQRYYDLEELKRYALDIQQLGFIWATSSMPPELPSGISVSVRIVLRVDRQDGFRAFEQSESVSMDFASVAPLLQVKLEITHLCTTLGIGRMYRVYFCLRYSQARHCSCRSRSRGKGNAPTCLPRYS